MIEYNEAENKMVLKLVFYGPALSGKTTNLLRLHDILTSDGRGDLMMLDTQGDRTIFFDLLPFFMVAPSGLKIKVKVYTVPGQVNHDATRKMVLQRVDGVAFIADSQKLESANNGKSFENLEENLKFVGLNIEKVPLVVQFNKRDLPNISSEEELKKIWGASSIPIMFASAVKGTGVLETFEKLASLVYYSVDHKHSLGIKHGLSPEEFVGRLTSSSPQEMNR